MSKLSTEEINHIWSSVDIVDVISKYIPLIQRGKNFFGVCPFHDDHSPSMSVSKDKQIYKCFSCGATGNVLKFVMDYENISFMEAIKNLADKAGINVNIDFKSIPSTNTVNKELYDIYDLSFKFYQNNLNTKEGMPAKEYLLNREINDEIIKEFGIGLSLKSRDTLTKLLLKKGFNINDIDRTGLIVKNDLGVIDIYCHRIMFPLYNLNGKVVGFSGRVFDGTSPSKYINTRETEIFKKGELLYNYHRAKDECRMKNQVIVMEGFMDVIRAYTVGVKNVVATMGTAVTKNQALLIKKMAKEVILLFDGDEAGAHATMTCSSELERIGVIPKAVRLKENLDPDEYIRKYGKDAFLKELENPINIMDFKLDYLKKNRNLDNANDVSSYVTDVLDELNKIDDDILREVTIKKVCKESDLDEAFLRSKLVDNKKEPVKIVESNVSIKKLSKYEKAENYLIYYMLHSPEVIELCIKKLSSLPTKSYRDLYRMIITYYKEFHDISEANFITYVLDKEPVYMDTLKQVSNYKVKENYTLEEINDYINIILDYNIEMERERLNKLLEKASTQEERIEIGNKLVELKIRRDKVC